MFWRFEPAFMSQIALVVDAGAPWTYADLDAQAEVWSKRIRAARSQGSAIASLEFDIAPDAIAAYLGALRAGVPLLVTEPQTAHATSQVVDIWRPELRIARQGTELALEVHTSPAPAAPPHPDLALMLSTSGSTGDPKLVRLSAQNIASNAEAIRTYLQIMSDDRAATTLPFFYSYGLSVLNSYLAAGASLYLTQSAVTVPPFLAALQANGVTSLALVPHQCDALLGAGFTGAQISTLRYITQAGGKLAAARVAAMAELGRAHGWDFFVMYGQTEAAPRISYVPPQALPDAADTIGQAVPGGRLWIADENGAPITGPDQSGNWSTKVQMS